MTNVSYGLTKSLGKMPLPEAERRVREALSTEGFGVLTEIDVQRTLKEKLGEEMRPYKILGACNPKLAHRAISGEPLIGLLLPCNVVVLEEPNGETTVSIGSPHEMFRIVENLELQPIAREAEERLRRVLERLGASVSQQ